MDDTQAEVPAGVALSDQPFPEESQTTLSDLQPATTQRSPAIGEELVTRQQRTVPYGALAEERARRKELQRELQNAVDEQRKLQVRLDLLHEIAQQRALDGGARAAPADNVGMRANGHELASDRVSGTQDQENGEAGAMLRTQVMNSVRDVMRERPDFVAAYQHARQARVAELMALGYAPQEALGITFDNELEIIRNAYANGHNPGHVIYEYARRHGYRGDAPGEVQGGAPSQSSTRPGAPSEAEKIALAARGQAASKSLSTAGGGATGTLTLEALAGMSDEEFAEATKGERWQKLLK